MSSLPDGIFLAAAHVVVHGLLAEAETRRKNVGFSQAELVEVNPAKGKLNS